MFIQKNKKQTGIIDQKDSPIFFWSKASVSKEAVIQRISTFDQWTFIYKIASLGNMFPTWWRG